MRLFGFSTLFLVIILLMTMLASQTLYNEHYEEGIQFDIYNFTEQELVWDSSILEAAKVNLTEGINKTTYTYSRVHNILYETMDWFGYVTFEMSKWAVEFGYNNPQYDFEFFADWTYRFLWIFIFIALTPILFVIAIIISLLIYWIHNKLKKKNRSDKKC